MSQAGRWRDEWTPPGSRATLEVSKSRSLRFPAARWTPGVQGRLGTGKEGPPGQGVVLEFACVVGRPECLEGGEALF